MITFATLGEGLLRQYPKGKETRMPKKRKTKGLDYLFITPEPVARQVKAHREYLRDRAKKRLKPRGSREILEAEYPRRRR